MTKKNDIETELVSLGEKNMKINDLINNSEISYTIVSKEKMKEFEEIFKTVYKKQQEYFKKNNLYFVLSKEEIMNLNSLINQSSN